MKWGLEISWPPFDLQKGEEKSILSFLCLCLSVPQSRRKHCIGTQRLFVTLTLLPFSKKNRVFANQKMVCTAPEIPDSWFPSERSRLYVDEFQNLNPIHKIWTHSISSSRGSITSFNLLAIVRTSDFQWDLNPTSGVVISNILGCTGLVYDVCRI